MKFIKIIQREDISYIYKKSNGMELGIICYDTFWKEFVFQPANNKQFSYDCQVDIAMVTKERNKEKERQEH